MPRDTPFTQTLCADVQGFSLHAAVRCDAHERQWREQLCRCVTRTALANKCVQCIDAGQVGLKLKPRGPPQSGRPCPANPKKCHLKNLLRLHFEAAG